MNKKKNLGQFYTTQSQYVIGSLINDIPVDTTIIDPFAGYLDLLKLFSNPNQISYDIDPKHPSTIQRDTLLDPPNYSNSFIVTNPPYLARNKNKDKTIYDKYQVNDLYKAAVRSIIGCQGGIIILPLNFFCDEDDSVRKEFLSKYLIKNINVFEEQVFNDTSYTVCSFSFLKLDGILFQDLKIKFFPGQKEEIFLIEEIDGFRIGASFYNLLTTDSKIKISRLLKNVPLNKNQYLTKLNLRAIDTGSENGRIALEVSNDPYYGISTDRAFATIVLSVKLNKTEQLWVADRFNEILEQYRSKYHSLFLTNFRNSTKNYARKRISFEAAYDLIRYVISEMEG